MNILMFWDRGAPSGLEIPVARIISHVLDVPVQVLENPVLYNGFERNRAQFDATSILTCLDVFSRRTNNSDMILLVIGDDIYRPGTRYIFGLSRPSTGSAVISASRLKNEYWNLPPDENMLMDRLARESAHEIGHLMHLDHCENETCVMCNPQTLDDLDIKKLWLCDKCKLKLKNNNIQIYNKN